MLVGSFECGQASDDLEELAKWCENRMHTLLLKGWNNYLLPRRDFLMIIRMKLKRLYYKEWLNKTKIVRTKDLQQVHHWRNRMSFSVLQLFCCCKLKMLWPMLYGYIIFDIYLGVMIYTKVQFIYSWVMVYWRSFFPIMLRSRYPFSYTLDWVKYKYLFLTY